MANSCNGILENIKKNRFVPKLLHSKHGKGLFSIAGFIDCSPEKEGIDKENESLNVSK